LNLTSCKYALNISNESFLTEISLNYPQHNAGYCTISTSFVHKVVNIYCQTRAMI